MQTMNALDAPLEGSLLVEASAGTGKTWTVGALMVRLIATGTPLPGILILTYTDAATADLRARMRQRLEIALEWLDGLPVEEPDALLEGLIQSGAVQAAVARQRLRQALDFFDEASIHTIHGFCRRVLVELGLGAGLSRCPQVEEQGAAALERVVLDQLRIWWARLPSAFLDWLAGNRTGSGFRAVKLIEPAAWESLVSKAGEGVELPAGQEELSLDAALARLESAIAGREARRLGSLEEMRQAGVDALHQVLGRHSLHGNTFKPDRFMMDLFDTMAWLEAGASVANPCIQSTSGRWKYTSAMLREKATGNDKKQSRFVDHPFFDAMELFEQSCDEQEAGAALVLRAMQLEALRQWPGRAEDLRLEEGRLDFQDLLRLVEQALRGPNAPRLLDLLRERWTVAMLDEFQDTDPLQVAIFQRIFQDAGLGLVMVGDPKQAIYAFRGADLDSYLRMAATAGDRRGLFTNWRSNADLIQAVNALFAHERFPDELGAFLHQGIRYSPVVPAPRENARRVQLARQEVRPFQVFQQIQSGLSKEKANALLCRHLALQVERLLNPSLAWWVKGGERIGPIEGGEVAILVRTSNQAVAVAQALARRGIASIQSGRESVWASEEAGQLIRLLMALERPEDSARVKTLLASGLARAMGGDPVLGLQDETLISRLQLELHHAAQEARRQSLATVVESLLDRLHWRVDLLGHPLGERRVVNWNHLLELLRLEEARTQLDPGSVARLIQAKAQEKTKPKEWEQRLESEDNLVRIVTMHKSKGLEYPVVFCPFLWERPGSSETFTIHRLPAKTDEAVGRSALQSPGLELPEAQKGELADAQLGESLRLAYVALTRASSQVFCYSLSSTASARNPAPLDWLLLPERARSCSHPGLPDAWKELSKSGAPEQLAAWRELAHQCEGIGVQEWGQADDAEPESVAPVERPVPLPPCATFYGQATKCESTASFTSLMRDVHADDRQDEWFTVAEIQAGDTASLQDASASLMSDEWALFPAGTSVGNCLHSLLEKGIAAGEIDGELCRRELQAAALPESHATFLARNLGGMLHRELGAGGPVPAKLGRGQWATELPFHLSTTGLAEGRLRELCRRHGLHDAGRLGVNEESTLRALERASHREPRALAEGFLKGFMDYCLCWQDQWWVLDWKSNRLAPRAELYTREAMVRSMAESGYFIQALIYLTALHRHLKRVMEKWDPAAQLGGLRYVYLRGLCDDDSDSGVLTDRLPLDLILELEEALGGRA